MYIITGPRRNIKTVFQGIEISIIKIERPSYLYIGNAYTVETVY